MGNIHGHKSSHKSKISVETVESDDRDAVTARSQSASVLKLFEVSSVSFDCVGKS